MLTPTTERLITQQLPDTPPCNQVLVIDKPVGPTSHDVIAVIRRHYGFKRKGEGKVKVGHAGTLDPLASGVLLVLVGEATKQAMAMTGLDKSYAFDVLLGQVRDTYDQEGEVLFDWYRETETDEATRRRFGIEQLQRGEPAQLLAVNPNPALDQLRGELLQKVPAYSAVKLDGKKLYELARAGKPLPYDNLPARTVTVQSLELTARETLTLEGHTYPLLHCHTDVSKGTFIRSLAHELGRLLGVGGCVWTLRRTRVGGYAVQPNKN